MSIQGQKYGRVSIRHSNHIRQEKLEWVANSFSRGSSQPQNQSHVSCVSCTGRWILYHWATWEAPTAAQKHPYYTADLWIHRSTYTPFFFPVGNTTWSRFHNPEFVESACAKEPWIKRADFEWPVGFPLCRRSVPLTPHCSRVNCTSLILWTTLIQYVYSINFTIINLYYSHIYLRVFLGGTSGKEPACQCRIHKRLGFNPWVRNIPVFLPGKSHGQRSLADYSPWGCKESDTTEAT